VSCELANTTVHGYFDGELDAVRAAEFEHHLQACNECSASLGKLESLHRRMQQAQLYETASPRLRQQIRTQLAGDADRARSPRRWYVVPVFAAAVMAAVFWLAISLVQPHTHSAQIAAELVDAHIRSLQPGHLMDVQSTDQHTVKPWFDGKIDFIPPVADYAEQGFPLLGGRLDVGDGRTVAAVVYGRRKHLINLFVWPDKSTSAGFASSGSNRGYNWLMWHTADMRFCLVSDVSAGDLQQLRELIHP
jgi:anti-sigma factor RsiW